MSGADQYKLATSQLVERFWQYVYQIRGRFAGVGPMPTLADEHADVVSVRTLRKNELVVRLISTLAGLVVTFGVSYYGIRWLVNAMDPTHHEKKEAQKRARRLLKNIGIESSEKLTEYELCIASNLVNPSSVMTNWEDIGGLSETIQEIQELIILPFKHQNWCADSELLQPPKGVLLYGPPGCGKTLVAKATAKAAGARFINLQVSTLVDKWYGESQKRAEAVFSLAHKLQPTIIFIDEIDSFLRVRASNDHEATSMMKTQFMSFWDGLLTDPKCRIMIIGATNRPNDVDAAILRRMPTRFHIGLPNARQRRQVLDIILKRENVDPSVNLDDIAEATDGLSGSDLREICRTAAICRLRKVMNEPDFNEDTAYSCERTRPITSSDFEFALNKMRQTAKQATDIPTINLD